MASFISFHLDFSDKGLTVGHALSLVRGVSDVCASLLGRKFVDDNLNIQLILNDKSITLGK